MHVNKLLLSLTIIGTSSFFIVSHYSSTFAQSICITADANCDGRVNNQDFNIFKDHYLSSFVDQKTGDFNSDGTVNGFDYIIWRQNFGSTAPEPTSVPTTPPATNPPPPTQPPATIEPPPPPDFPEAEVQGIWTSPEELKSKPTSGPAWNAVKSAADKLSANPSPDLDDQNDRTNTNVLAAAIVYARTGNNTYKNKVVNALRKVESFSPNGRTLAWARETGAYALAADLIGYRTPTFQTKMRDMAEKYKGSQTHKTLLGMYKMRPNNWGTQAFGSLTAIYRYLDDNAKLREIRDYLILGIRGEAPEYRFGSLTWQYDENKPRLINPKGATKNCGGTVNVDGITPDDMRRGGNCRPDPEHTGYAWEGLQGLTMGAYILERAGMPIWNAEDAAICRAASAYQDGRFGSEWKAESNDEWQLVFLDHGCGRNWSDSYGSGKWLYGKNTGWGYVLPEVK